MTTRTSPGPRGTNIPPGRHGLLPPRATGWPIMNMLRYIRNPYAAMQRGLTRGDCYASRMPGRPATISFTSPEAIKDIFGSDPDTLRGGEAMHDLLGPIIGANSLLVIDGQRWSRERRLMQPAFHGERLHTYAATISQITSDVIDSWPLGRPLPIQEEMKKITLEVIMRVVFGVEDAAKLGALRVALLRFLTMLDGPSAAFLFFSVFQVDIAGLTPWGRFVRRRRAWLDIVLDEINRRRAEGTEGRTDVLSVLIAARDEEGQPMTDQELLDEMVTILGAGHETTATSLAWTFNHVLSRPDILAKLRAELDAVVGAGPLLPGHLEKLVYLDAVIKETQRLTPVATAILRRVNAPIRIGSYDVYPGVDVSAPIYTLHHHPAYWTDPETFNPDRFIDGKPQPFTFFPFGGGPRRCLGAAFASYEMKIVLAHVLLRATMYLAPGYRAHPVVRAVAVGPSGGVPVIVDSISPRPFSLE